MALTTKISQLPAKGAKISDTDLLPLAVVDGASPSGYTTKKITGEEIKNALKLIITNTTTAAVYSLVLTDQNKLIIVDNATANVVNVRLNSVVSFPTGTQVLIVQEGAGQVTITPETGVVIGSESNKYKTAGRYAMATLIKVAADSWYLSGNLQA